MTQKQEHKTTTMAVKKLPESAAESLAAPFKLPGCFIPKTNTFKPKKSQQIIVMIVDWTLTYTFITQTHMNNYEQV